MSECNETVSQPDFIDRKTRLTVFGILQIVLGGFCGMMVPFMIFGIIASTATGGQMPEGSNLKTMIPVCLLYIVVAAWFISMGIGSLKARRWARALILASSWYWLVIGVGGFLLMLMLMPKLFGEMATTDKMPKVMSMIIPCIILGFTAVFYIIIPGLLVLFYRGRDVKATCEHHDPQTRWTDQCPLPVLGTSLACVLWALCVPMMGSSNWTIPFFGTVLVGIAGAVTAVALCLILVWAAWGLYRLDAKAWWATLLLIGGWSVSVIITFSTVSTEMYYEKAGMTEQQIETIKQFDMLSMRSPMLLWVVFALVYLFWIRKYFNKSDQQPVGLTDHLV